MSKYRHISQFNKPVAITTFQGINKHSPGCDSLPDNSTVKGREGQRHPEILHPFDVDEVT